MGNRWQSRGGSPAAPARYSPSASSSRKLYPETSGPSPCHAERESGTVPQSVRSMELSQDSLDFAPIAPRRSERSEESPSCAAGAVPWFSGRKGLGHSENNPASNPESGPEENQPHAPAGRLRGSPADAFLNRLPDHPAHYLPDHPESGKPDSLRFHPGNRPEDDFRNNLGDYPGNDPWTVQGGQGRKSRDKRQKPKGKIGRERSIGGLRLFGRIT